MEAVLQVSVAANREIYNEIRRQSKMSELIRNLMANMNLTWEQAMSAMSVPAEKWGFYKARL